MPVASRICRTTSAQLQATLIQNSWDSPRSVGDRWQRVKPTQFLRYMSADYGTIPFTDPRTRGGSWLSGAAMAKGDHIYVTRPLGYTHHGIDCGDGTVIHFTGEPGKKSDASIARSMLADFALDSIVHMRDYSAKDDSQVVIDRAKSKLGSKDYNLVTNNCEHFATWCCTGRTASEQVRRVSSLTTSGAAAAASLGTTAGVVGAVGSVAGLSGAGVMSALGTAGGLVGSGAAAGPLVIDHPSFKCRTISHQKLLPLIACNLVRREYEATEKQRLRLLFCD